MNQAKQRLIEASEAMGLHESDDNHVYKSKETNVIYKIARISIFKDFNAAELLDIIITYSKYGTNIGAVYSTKLNHFYNPENSDETEFAFFPPDINVSNDIVIDEPHLILTKQRLHQAVTAMGLHDSDDKRIYKSKATGNKYEITAASILVDFSAMDQGIPVISYRLHENPFSFTYTCDLKHFYNPENAEETRFIHYQVDNDETSPLEFN